MNFYCNLNQVGWVLACASLDEAFLTRTQHHHSWVGGHRYEVGGHCFKEALLKGPFRTPTFAAAAPRL